MTSGFGFGGAGTVIIDKAIHFAQKGWKVVVISMTPPFGRIQMLENEGVIVESLGMKQGRINFISLLKALRLVKKYRADIVHAHTYPANIFCRALKLLMPRTPFINTIHNTHEGPPVRYRIYRFTRFLTTRIISISQDATDRHVSTGATPAHRLRIINNGLHTERYQPTKEGNKKIRAEFNAEGDFLWLAAGRLYPQKDYPNLLRAFSEHLKKHPKSKLLIAGEGPLYQELKEQIDSLQLSEKVFLTGGRNDMPDLMTAADALVMSSAWEGLPMALLEASAMRLPIVSTDVGSVRTIVQHEEAGLLCEPENTESLLSAMDALQALPAEKRKAMGEKGREQVQKQFDIGKILKQWEALYEELL